MKQSMSLPRGVCGKRASAPKELFTRGDWSIDILDTGRKGHAMQLSLSSGVEFSKKSCFCWNHIFSGKFMSRRHLMLTKK